MTPLNIPSTRTTPAIFYNPAHAWFRVVGTSIPENANEFYAPINRWLTEHVDRLPDGCAFEFSLPYFNSSSLKALYTLLTAVQKGIATGKRFTVTWYTEQDDEFMQETGQAYREMLGMEITIERGHIEAE